MGHYLSEMACGKCGEVRCTCPSKPRPVTWVVNREFAVRRADTVFYYPDIPRFASKEAAEEAVPDLIRNRINELEAEIDMLNTILDLKTGVEHDCFCGGGYR